MHAAPVEADSDLCASREWNAKSTQFYEKGRPILCVDHQVLLNQRCFHFVRSAQGDDAPVVDDADLVRTFRLFQIMGGQKDCRTALRTHLLQVSPKAAPRRGIQARCRLVEKKHL